jgi:hypothetical protein
MASDVQKPLRGDMKAPRNGFKSILQADVPKGREGKHKRIITRLLADIERLDSDSALKIPLAELPDSKENIRSALCRASRQKGINVSTSSDADHLYVWKTQPDL